MNTKEEILKMIVNIEKTMFRNVHRNMPKDRCESLLKAFTIMRYNNFKPFSEKTLRLYLTHLEDVMPSGRNLMKDKYARMEDLIPPLNDNPIIDNIVNIEKKWQEEVVRKYPNIFKQSFNPFDETIKEKKKLTFEKYLRSELETYSDLTIESYYDDLINMQKEGKNLAYEIYNNIFKEIGFESLEDANNRLGKDLNSNDND